MVSRQMFEKNQYAFKSTGSTTAALVNFILFLQGNCYKRIAMSDV